MADQPAPCALPISLSLTALFEPEGEGWIHASLPALPGVLTCARSREEARAMLADALREYLLSCEPEEAKTADEAARDQLVLTIS